VTIFPDKPAITSFIGAKDGDNWNCKVCEAESSSQIIITSKPTPRFLQAGCRSCCPTNIVKALKVNIVLTLQ